MRSARTYSFIHPAIVVLACTLPGLSAMAAPMDVHTRNLDGTTDNLGRGGGSFYTDQRDAGLEAQQSEAGKAAWDKTKAGAERAWDKTKAVATQPPAVSPDEPQRYGRAGGFIGAEQFEVPQPGVTAFSSAPANAVAVKSGESQWGYTDRTATGASAGSGSAASAAAASAPGSTQTEQQPAQR